MVKELMVDCRRRVVVAFALLSAIISQPSTSFAQLTATVSPGYTFAPGEAPTTATLNLLGLPGIAISGTIAGSAALAPNSVTGDLLKDSVVDGITLGFNAASPRQLEVTNGGVGPNQVSTNLAGAGIGGGWNGVTGVPLFVNYLGVINTNQFAVDGGGHLILAGTSNAVPSGSGAQVPCVSPMAVVAGGTLQITNFTYGPITFTNHGGLVANAAHGMTNGTPRLVRWVMVEVSAGGDSGYTQGQEVDVGAFANAANSGWPALIGGGNATSVFCSAYGGNYFVIDGSTGAGPEQITLANWNLKCYAWQ
jgi:hypothetical protein